MGEITNNFNEKMIAKINEILEFVINNKYSVFYKERFSHLPEKIASLEDFQRIPLLSKDDFLDIPLTQRTFVAPHEVAAYTLSSGTMKSGKVTIVPHFHGKKRLPERLTELDYGEQLLDQGLAKKVMLLWPVSSSAFSHNIRMERKNSMIIPADVNNLKNAAFIARKIKADGIITTSTILDFFIEECDAAGFDKKAVKLIFLGGEFCSPRRLDYLKNHFPNAYISLRFGSSEIGGRGYRCKHLAAEKPNVFHPSPYSLIEIAEDGEIIHTTLNPRPFPLIRYKTGDIATLKKHQCLCGNDLLLEVGGRNSSDLLKFSGVTLHAQAIENALDPLDKYLTNFFQMHVFEKESRLRLKAQLELHLELKPEHENLSNDHLFLEFATKIISNNLRLSTKSTLQNLVEKNLFLPLKISFPKNKKDSKKSRYIVSHLD